MRIASSILGFHEAVMLADLRTEGFQKLYQTIRVIADRPQLVPSYDEVYLVVEYLRRLPKDSKPVIDFGAELETRFARYSFFFREAQEALAAVNVTATLAAAANLFGINGKRTMPWEEAKAAIANASKALDSYLDGDSEALGLFTGLIEEVFELGLSCTSDPNSNFDVGEEVVSDLIKRRDGLFVSVLLEQL